MKLPEQTIKSIAQDLDCGLVCYIHKETKEVISVIAPDNYHYADMEYWEKEIEEVENNAEQYLKIEKMPSRDAFQVMADFVEEVRNPRIQNKLITALNKRKT